MNKKEKKLLKETEGTEYRALDHQLRVRPLRLSQGPGIPAEARRPFVEKEQAGRPGQHEDWHLRIQGTCALSYRHSCEPVDRRTQGHAQDRNLQGDSTASGQGNTLRLHALSRQFHCIR